MRFVEILKGLPGSAKSTYALEKVAKSNCGIVRVNKDSLRLMLNSGKYSKGNEKYILQLRDHIILTALDSGKSVIVDDTNFEPIHEERIIDLVNGFNECMYGNNISDNKVQVKVKFFNVSLEECIVRDLKRANSVGEKVIRTMYNKYLKPEPEKIKVMKQDSSLPHALVIDLDGTVALKGERSAYEYHRVDEDTLNVPVANIVKSYLHDPSTHIIYISGREDSCRELSKTWLKKHGLFYDWYIHLHMRKTGDNRKDTIVKKEIFDAEIKDKYYIKFILDDRNSVVKMWRSLGLPCFQVQDGDF